ncbi:glycosyltransferase [Neobacillus notoginsengisoli]|uniref:Glycosyltransferase n=1 Tax=Neobacillus notoginsengisoli TaxID=1578198 RepID=A0A417Z0C9_9BACI|nr:glycosyltransferase [Neobacillus notoginsengisoli]RHW43572.1 glycosyltransferase [Neobacillus notoginsengisoli]
MKVSMVMAVHNGEKFLGETLQSIFAQTYPHLEIIIVNDGSTDSTKFILDHIEDPRVRFIHLEENQGAANALNIGINAAKGDWIAIQDADDISYPSRIEDQVNYLLENPSLVGIGTFVKCISGDQDIPDSAYEGMMNFKNSYVTRKQIRKVIYWGCPFTHSSVMFSKQVFSEVGGYDPQFKIAYDYDLWLKLLEKGDMEIVPKVLLDYRMHKSSLSNSDGYATLDEVQIASSRAIFRSVIQKGYNPPSVCLIGPHKACNNYLAKIVPRVDFDVFSTIDNNQKKKIANAIRNVENGNIDAILVLDFPEKHRILRMFWEKGLRFNKDVFLLINELE